MSDKRAARIELIDKESGKPIEECDVYTRTNLVSCEDGSLLSEKLDSVDDRLYNLENPYKEPEVVHHNYNKQMMIDGGDYTVTFEIIKGTLPVNDIIISVNEVDKHISEENISILNNSGSLNIDCDIHPTDTGIYKAIIYVMDDNTSVSDDVSILFEYPSYCFMINSNITNITDDIILANDPFIIENSSENDDREYTFNINECNNQRIVFASPYELSKIKDINGFDVTSCFNHNMTSLKCSDETERAYHVYYSKILNLHDFKFKFII